MWAKSSSTAKRSTESCDPTLAVHFSKSSDAAPTGWLNSENANIELIVASEARTTTIVWRPPVRIRRSQDRNPIFTPSWPRGMALPLVALLAGALVMWTGEGVGPWLVLTWLVPRNVAL